MTIHLVGIML